MTTKAHTIRTSVDIGGQQISSSNTYSSEGQTGVTVSVPDESTDLQVVFAIDFSQVKSIIIQADGGDLTVETNNGTTPDDTLALTDGSPYIWNEDSLDTLLITADVTALYLTNASGAAVTFQIDVIYDSTP